MLVTVSPAKRLDWAARPEITMTAPDFPEDAAYLASVARALSAAELKKLMGISDNLAKLNRERFQDFSADPAPDALRPAAMAFAGDTYAGLEAPSLEAEELAWAQDHLRILSGLYGLLRPLDGIQPYRLEMGSRLANREGANLYAYWGARLAKALQAQAVQIGSDCLVACASNEYFSAVDPKAHTLRVITPVFLEERANGEAKIVSFYAKKARGAMARFIIQHRLTDPAALQDFDLGGYRYDAERSSPDQPVFLRNAEAEKAA
ncbi:MAG: peroxide stress protein YaaA [Mangrovicoccus sp.]|nr:peroxide stress protein YaaA [Mangrovicoccus sp.]